MKEKKIVFDVMSNWHFVCTMRMPITLDMVVDYDGDKPIIDGDALKRYVEQKRPTLKYVDYNILF